MLAPKNTRTIQTIAYQKRRHQKESRNAGDNSRQNQGKKTPVRFGHVSRMDSNRIPFLALQTMVEGVRSRGRPRARWRDGVIEDIQEQGLEFSAATSLTKDRDGWRKFARPYRRDGADGRD